MKFSIISLYIFKIPSSRVRKYSSKVISQGNRYLTWWIFLRFQVQWTGKTSYNIFHLIYNLIYYKFHEKSLEWYWHPKFRPPTMSDHSFDLCREERFRIIYIIYIYILGVLIHGVRSNVLFKITLYGEEVKGQRKY